MRSEEGGEEGRRKREKGVGREGRREERRKKEKEVRGREGKNRNRVDKISRDRSLTCSSQSLRDRVVTTF